MISASRFLGKNKGFFFVLGLLFVVSAIFYQRPMIAMWIGFAIAGYSAIANDSIQTLGTFLASNKHRPWWVLWLFIGVSMAATFLIGWYMSGTGDVAHGRLAKIPQPETFEYLQLAAPIILLLLTKLSMPVSTTFLILSVFSTGKTIESMLVKTFIGYGVAILSGYLVWYAVSYFWNKRNVNDMDDPVKIADTKWYVLQWCTTLFLWVAWLMQDISNVAVFLPRSLTLTQILIFSGFLFFGMGLLFYLRGGEIQEVVTEKTDITNVKSATLVDFIYAIILYIFKWYNSIPMSTTWVFLGLLAGRELALALHSKRHNTTYEKSLVLVTKDLVRAGLGLVISIGLAVLVSM